jgi:hypothetical protein
MPQVSSVLSSATMAALFTAPPPINVNLLPSASFGYRLAKDAFDVER